MSRVGIEPTIPVFHQGETVHALDRTATVLDLGSYKVYEKSSCGDVMSYDLLFLQTKNIY
jgi:hypothetical protein